ncbi:MAG TPA: ornithine cyclodeaminase family protein [Anaerolineae bacterium]
MLYLTESEFEQLVPMSDALIEVEACFRALGEGRAQNRPRQRVMTARVVHNTMPAGWGERGYTGLKTYTSGPNGTRFWVHLFDAHTGDPVAVIEANRLGQRRTGAASGVATKFLARADASTLAVIGAGWQAESQIEAICLVRKIREIRCYSWTPEHTRRFVERMRARPGFSIEVAASAEAAVRQADIIVTATSARESVISGEWIAAGAHINAIGANWLNRRELDDAAVVKSAKIFVDSLEQAKLESGDLHAPVVKQLLDWERVRELGELVAGKVAGRENEQEVTLFKSHGIALEDIAVGALAVERARQRGLGRES